MEFLAPAALWGLLSLLVLYFFYLFRQRQLTREFPSLMIWEKTRSSRENWARRRRQFFDLLLFLQLLTALCLTLAASRPVWYQKGPAPMKLAVVIDLTASMKAPYRGHKSRWEKAREEIQSLLSHLQPRDRIRLFTLPRRPGEEGLWLTPGEVENRLQELSPQWATTSVPAEVDSLQSQFTKIEKWFLFTDQVNSQTEVEIISVGEARENGAIVNATPRRLPGSEKMEILFEVGHYGQNKKRFQLVGARQKHSFTLNPNETKSLVISLDKMETTTTFNLLPGDFFPLDNRIWIGAAPREKIKVAYRGRPQSPLYFALKAQDQLRFVSRPSEAHLLVTTDRSKLLTSQVVLLPSSEESLKKPKSLKVRSTGHLSRLDSQFPSLKFDVHRWRDLSSKSGHTPFLKGPEGQWLATWREEKNREIWEFAFFFGDRETEWSRQPTFPYFWTIFIRRLSEMMPRQGQTFTVGESREVPLKWGGGVVIAPGGKRRELEGDSFDFHPLQVGLYKIQTGGETYHLPSNFCLQRESDLHNQERPFTSQMIPSRPEKAQKTFYLKRFLIAICFLGMIVVWIMRERE